MVRWMIPIVRDLLRHIDNHGSDCTSFLVLIYLFIRVYMVRRIYGTMGFWGGDSQIMSDSIRLIPSVSYSLVYHLDWLWIWIYFCWWDLFLSPLSLFVLASWIPIYVLCCLSFRCLSRSPYSFLCGKRSGQCISPLLLSYHRLIIFGCP